MQELINTSIERFEEMALDQAVKAICDALDGLANAVYEGKKDDQALIDKGWRSNLASIVQWSAVWINVLLTMLSVSAPVWLGWVATKQIAQRFRLAEDYAYKASISNARCLISCANKGKSPHRAGFSCPWGEAFANKALGNVLHCT